ncbi:hypothetical protein A2304_05270, partial [Candidatus Uhrbacteria bacterium RIFOXYB2_FULL_57_15]
MGAGSTSSVRVQARSQARQGATAQQVFSSNDLYPGMNPNGLVVRESRDSDEHPDSIAVGFMMDITGSMQSIPHKLATTVMPEFMPGLARVNPHVQVLFGAFGDAEDADYGGAWQIGQFETDDNRADEWLTRTWLDGSGGSWGYESSDLAFFFFGYHTSIDCWKMRQRKGYAFVTTDDTCRPSVSARTVNRLLGRKELREDLPIDTVLAKAAQMYHVFVLIPDANRAAKGARYLSDNGWEPYMTVEAHWRKRLGTHGTVVVLACAEDTAVVSSILFGLREGAYGSLTAILGDLETNF